MLQKASNELLPLYRSLPKTEFHFGPRVREGKVSRNLSLCGDEPVSQTLSPSGCMFPYNKRLFRSPTSRDWKKVGQET